MILDTHLHTKEHSPDSFLPVRDAVERARELGLGGLCVTDHDSWDILPEAEALRRECHFPLFVGIEILTAEGDFVVFGVGPFDYEPRRLRAADLMERVRESGGAAVAAHPYRDNGRGAGKLIKTLPGLTGVECFNGSTKHEANLQALRDARARGLACLGASDAHLVERVGRFATRFDGEPRNERDLIQLIRAGACEPVALGDAGGQGVPLSSNMGETAYVLAETWTLSQISGEAQHNPY
ncbi:MAG: PHP domain-containing protein [Fretibacterium sp.]|nr:PHP domain-containing protein [Fretibacterium sp.]